ncbi:TRAP transporter substrate-binding protein [Pseudoflavonifractor phocaeensis]|uniref:TRAP transporter substrate-binding protein n=1 Tax=Pseudoflavonifractor phocaeensis TaxID=1870988 RepID=UPI001F405C43|nr:TRAP transporter substrate-binding protein [Pseudoflavonifractor phocaeensis]MCF2662780.1 TRAP transporter substrate-binding protein [Pseudoflavonifractor phocaeensis]
MKKMTSLLLAMAMVLSLAACGGGDKKPAASTGNASTGNAAASTGTTNDDPYADLDEVELVGGDSTGKGAAGQIFGELVASKVDEITGGKLTIDYHPNGDLGGDADLLRQLQSNDIQIVVCQTAPVVSFIPEMAVFDLPMVFAKYDGATIDKVLNGADSAFKAQLNEAYEAADMHLLGFLQNATYRLTTANVELKDLASFKGLQIRTMENSNHMAFWSAIGAEPTPLAWAEVYFALQSGAIDAQENAADTCVGANFQEVQKYLACTNHILYANQICINKEAYEDLDPAYQAALDQAVAEALAEMAPQLAKIDTDNKQVLKDGGMTIIEYAPEFYDEILALDGVQALYKQIDEAVGGLATTLQESLANA